MPPEAATSVFLSDFGIPFGSKMGSKNTSKNETKNTYDKNHPKVKKSDAGGGVRRNAEAGGEDPRRGIRSDQS